MHIELKSSVFFCWTQANDSPHFKIGFGCLHTKGEIRDEVSQYMLLMTSEVPFAPPSWPKTAVKLRQAVVVLLQKVSLCIAFWCAIKSRLTHFHSCRKIVHISWNLVIWRFWVTYSFTYIWIYMRMMDSTKEFSTLNRLELRSKSLNIPFPSL